MSEHHVILGGGGFIARHVALRLLAAGQKVTLVVRHNRIILLPQTVQQSCAIVTTPLGATEWDALVAKADVVHHYAWGSIPASANANPSADLQANVCPTIDLLDALRRRGGGRVIFTSSGGTVYGKVRDLPIPEDHSLAPMSAYGASKVAAEVFFCLYRSLYNIDCRIARIANAYGAGQDPQRGLGAVTTFLYKSLNKTPLTIWGDGEVVRDYVHVSDISAFLVLLAQAPFGEEFIFNVGNGVGTSLNEIIVGIERHLGYSLIVQRTDNRNFDIPVNILSIERAKRTFGWQPRLLFPDGLAMTLADIKEGKMNSTLLDV